MDMPHSAASRPTAAIGETVGILAGTGRIPCEVAEAVCKAGRRVHIVAIDANVDPDLAAFPCDRVGIGQVGAMLSALHRNGCRDLVITGGLSRPDPFAQRIDWGFVRHLPRILALMRGGDDSVLRRVIGFFQSQGFTIRSIPEVAPGLLAGLGPIAGPGITSEVERDAEFGQLVVRELGDLDVGQAVIIRSGSLVAVEAAEGTDGMLQRLAADRSAGGGQSGGVLVKAPKPNQDLRVDLPTIGPRTVENCRAAGIAAIAVEAGCSVVAERALTTVRASDLGVAMLGLPAAGDDQPNAPAVDTPAPVRALSCLTRQSPDRRARRDIDLALKALDKLARYTPSAAVVVSRENVLAASVSEPVPALVNRALSVRQWGDRRKARRQGVLALQHPGQLTVQDLSAVAAAHLRGIVVRAEADGDGLTEQARQADQHGLFLTVGSQ